MPSYTVLVLSIVAVIIGMYFLGLWCGIWPPVSALFERESDNRGELEMAVEINEDDEEYDEEYLKEEEQNFRRDSADSKEAVEVNPARTYGPETLEVALMTLRLTKPHLFAPDWYEQSRREYSIHAARHAQERAQFRRGMGLAA